MVIFRKHCWQNQLAGHATRGEALGDGFSCRPEGHSLCTRELNDYQFVSTFNNEHVQRELPFHIDKTCRILRRTWSLVTRRHRTNHDRSEHKFLSARQSVTVFTYLTSVDVNLKESRITITVTEVASHLLCTHSNRQRSCTDGRGKFSLASNHCSKPCQSSAPLP